MKKLLVYLLIIVAVVVAVDLALSASMRRYVQTHELPGDYHSVDYLLKGFDNDVLILGSSVALNSLDPEMLADSLGLDAYNGASNGQTLTYHLTMLRSVLERHTPRGVLLGIQPLDLANEGDGARINLLSPYYGLGYAAIDSVLNGQSAASPVLMQSALYRYNTIWFRILLYHFIEPGIKGAKGYIAKDRPSVFPAKDVMALDFDTLSAQRRAELTQIVDLCRDKGVELAVFFPPVYHRIDGDLHGTPLYREVDSLLRANGMTLYDDSQAPEFATDSTLYYDNSHLNVDGSRLYTQYFINRLANDSIF